MISLLHPSRGRAEKAKQTFDNWMSKISEQNTIQHVLSIDTDDYLQDLYLKLFPNSHVVCGQNKNLVEATNVAAESADGDILVLLSDDFDCPYNWDKLIVDAIGDHECVVLKTFDGVQEWIVTLPIMDHKYYKLHGCFYHPEYQHMFCDTDMTHLADLTSRLLIRNDITFPHNHYTTGKCIKDSTNERADRTWIKGEQIYLRRVRECFGIKYIEPFDPIDPINLCNEAEPHLKWLKKKLSNLE